MKALEFKKLLEEYKDNLQRIIYLHCENKIYLTNYQLEKYGHRVCNTIERMTRESCLRKARLRRQCNYQKYRTGEQYEKIYFNSRSYDNVDSIKYILLMGLYYPRCKTTTKI